MSVMSFVHFSFVLSLFFLHVELGRVFLVLWREILQCSPYLKSKLIIYKQRVPSSVPLQFTEEAPFLVFQYLLCSLLRTL